MKGLHNGIKGLHKGIEKVNKNMETYRSGRNENDSKSCGELSVSSTKNLVTMRVLPGSKN